MPKVTVIMPVYNGEKYLREAIDSILNQTYTDFEFIIINDCSSDDTEKIILSYQDERIVYLKNEKNSGVAATLNRGLDIAKGEYIARMDADDISLPQRFEKQVNFMAQNPEIGVCGTGGIFFGAKDGQFFNADDPKQARIDLLFSSCLAHPTVMVRGILIKEDGFRYDPSYDKVEDYELWIRISQKYQICSLKECLFKYRVHKNQVTQNYTQKHFEKMYLLQKRQLEHLSASFTDNEVYLFSANIEEKKKNLLGLSSVFTKIYRINKSQKIYHKKLLRKTLCAVLLSVFQQQNAIGVVQLAKNSSVLVPVDLLLFYAKNLVRKMIKK